MFAEVGEKFINFVEIGIIDLGGYGRPCGQEINAACH